MEFNIFHLQRAVDTLLAAILFYISNIFERNTSGSCVGGEHIPVRWNILAKLDKADSFIGKEYQALEIRLC